LWDFVALADDLVDRLPAFIRKWGLLDSMGDAAAQPGVAGKQDIRDWEDAVDEVRRLLIAIAHTEQQIVMPESELRDAYGEFDNQRYTSFGRLEDVDWDPLGVTNEALAAANAEAERKQTAYFRAEYRAGRGLDLQRRLIVRALAGIARPDWHRSRSTTPELQLPFSYLWDDKGRRLVVNAVGVREIVASHVFSMFAGPEMDIFVCAVCGKPFSHEHIGMKRRPRRNVNALCSAACRNESKKASNRSWWIKERGMDQSKVRPKGVRRGRKTRKR
jgi:hypothetical protein